MTHVLQPKSGEGRASLKGAPDTSRGFFEAISHLVFHLSLTGIVTDEGGTHTQGWTFPRTQGQAGPGTLTLDPYPRCLHLMTLNFLEATGAHALWQAESCHLRDP